MSTQKGIQTQGQPGDAKLVSNLPIPKVREEWIVVKVVAVALNPTDWMHVDRLDKKGLIIGCDYAGVVEEVGSAVTNGLKKGDRVAGWTHGGKNHLSRLTCFGVNAEDIVTKEMRRIRRPALLLSTFWQRAICKSKYRITFLLRKLRLSELVFLLLGRAFTSLWAFPSLTSLQKKKSLS